MSGWGWLHQVCCFAEFRSFVIYNLFFVKRKFFCCFLIKREGTVLPFYQWLVHLVIPHTCSYICTHIHTFYESLLPISTLSLFVCLYFQPTWHPYPSQQGQLLEVAISYPAVLWPWSGYLAVSLGVTSEGRSYVGTAEGHIAVVVSSPNPVSVCVCVCMYVYMIIISN